MFTAQPHGGYAVEAPLDIDTALFEVSNRMARAQIARQVSNNSSLHRQRGSRVTKTHSAGNSPQDVHGRRAASASRSARCRASMSSYPVQQTSGSMAGYQQFMQPNTRPVTWHASTFSPQWSEGSAWSTFASQLGDSPTPFHGFALHGFPTPVTQADGGVGTPAEQWLNFDVSAEQDRSTNRYYGYVQDALDTTFEAPGQYVPLPQYPMSTMPMMPTYAAASPDYDTTQAWAMSLSSFQPHTAPPTPDFLAIQEPYDLSQDADPLLRQLSPEDGKELVGMGLYDRPERDSFSFDGAYGSRVTNCLEHSKLVSMGKGLKLEDAWEPPEDEHCSEDESTQGDAEHQGEAEEAQAGVPTSGQACIDLSNQSFFFGDNQLGMSGDYDLTGLTTAAHQQSYPVQDYGWTWMQ